MARFEILPGNSEELFYSNSPREQECIGHLRADFGSGKEFFSSWWSHGGNAHNDSTFRKELNALLKELRKDILKDRAHMRRYMSKQPGLLLERNPMTRGYRIITDKYEYFLRCAPAPGCYDAHLYCYLKG